MPTIADTITLGKEIQDKLALYLAVTGFNGVDAYNTYYKDISVVYSLIRALERAQVYLDNLTFFELETAVSKINEYYFVKELADPTFVRSAVEEATSPAVSPTGDWESYTITVSSNGESVFTGLPFNVGNIDIDTLFLTVNGDTIPYNINSNQDGYHIVGTTLNWHYFYELRVGDIIIIKWRE